MDTVKLQTESYLFESLDKKFRAFPFYELSYEEWVVYENGHPKYLLDFNRRNKPLIQDLKIKLNKGEDLEDIVWKLGRFLGKEWTTKHNIEGLVIKGSQKIEAIELTLLDDLSDLFIDLIFVATDNIDCEILLNDQKLFDTFSNNNELLLESSFIDNYDNLIRMLSFLFKTDTKLKKLASNNAKDVFDLTSYKQNCLSEDELEINYNEWIDIVKRENTMDEFGHLLGIIHYINRFRHKNHLVLIAEKRKHWK